MSRRRSLKLLGALAAASLVVAACSSGDDDDAVSGNATTGSAATTTAAATEGTGGTDATETTEATDESTADTTEGTTATLPGAEDVGKVGGSACGIPHGPYEAGDAPTGEVRVAFNQAAYSFNTNTIRGNASANANISYLLTGGISQSGFAYYDKDLNYINNDQFGTCTVESLDPLTIKYTINEGVTWSDGAQVSAADMLLTWAGQSGVFNDADTVVTEDTGVTAQADANGSPVVIGPDGAEIDSTNEAAYTAAFDADSGALLDGYTYKASTGIAFDGSSESLQLITKTPTISDDGRSLTATWDTFYVDYPTAGVLPGVPAHVVAEKALGISDPAAAEAALVKAIQDKDTAKLKPIAETWNTYFDATSLPADAGVYAGYGPYKLTAFTDDGTMTFEANEDYKWGPQPHVKTIVYSIIGDPTAAVQAMENEEVDVIQPQATADILTQLKGIADRGVEVIQDDGATYEHIDLAVNNGGPFDPATYGGDAAKALAVRQAFLHAVPRQDIIDRLIKPLNENAEVRNAQVAVPGEPFYDKLVAANGSDEYAKTDIELSKKTLADAGISTATPIAVRLLFADQNPRRASEYELIRDSVAKAGFNLIDGRDINWSPNLPNTSLYDAALFGWQTTAVAVSDSMANYVTDGANNYYGYSNAKIDELNTELNKTSDADRQDEILIEVEKNLFGDAFGLPIFQHPSITAYNKTYVEGVSNIPISPTFFYNVWDWKAAS